jgi:hypothetical protein
VQFIHWTIIVEGHITNHIIITDPLSITITDLWCIITVHITITDLRYIITVQDLLSITDLRYITIIHQSQVPDRRFKADHIIQSLHQIPDQEMILTIIGEILENNNYFYKYVG